MSNFWDHHGFLFLVFIALFPRLTLLFSSVPFGGLLWWVGFIFAPRILVAILATLNYWQTNPVLVIISWIVALSGESREKKFMSNRVRVIRYSPPAGRSGPSAPPSGPTGDIIEPEYERID